MGRGECLGVISLWSDLGLKVWKFNRFDLESIYDVLMHFRV